MSALRIGLKHSARTLLSRPLLSIIVALTVTIATACAMQAAQADEDSFEPFRGMLMTDIAATNEYAAMGEGQLVDAVERRAERVLLVDEFGDRALADTDDVVGLSDALKAQKRDLVRSPNDRDALYRTQVILFELRQLDEALRTSDRLIESHPRFVDGFVSRSNLLLRMERYESAIGAATRGLALAPDSESLLINRGLAYSDSGKLELAKADYDKAIRIHNSVFAYNNRGNLLSTQRKYQDAIADFDRALKIQETDYLYRSRGAAHLRMGNNELALADYSKAIELNPANAKNYLKRGRYYFSVGNFPASSADLTLAVAYSHNDASAMCDLGASLTESGKPDLALAHLQRSNELRPNDALTLANLAFVYSQLGESETGLEYADQAIRADETLALAHYNRGTILSDSGEYDEAIDSFSRAIDLNPDSTSYRNNRGVAYRLSKDFARAESDFRDLVEKDENNALAWSNLGRVMSDQGKFAEAAEFFDQAVKRSPNDAAYLSLRASNCLKLDKPSEAIADLRKATEIDPQESQYWFELGNAYLEASQLEDAVAALSESLERNPQDSSSLINRSFAYLNLRQYPQSQRDAEAALEIVPLDADATYNLAMALFRQNQYAKAAYQFSFLVGSGDSSVQVRSLRADCFLNIGRYADAVTGYTETLELAPGDAGVLHARGYTLAVMGESDRALADFDAAIKINPGRARTHLLRARVLRGERRYREAIAGFRTVLNLEPNAWEPTAELACLLAATPDETLRSGKEALELAEKAKRLSENETPLVCLAEATALAELRRFGEAVIAAEKSTELSRRAGQNPIGWLPTALQSFRDEEPHRFPVPTAEEFEAGN